ncbi:MAG TPA: HAD-IA family hydrolase [Candidatus Nanoarchaeia archaeon]|nr:HAD-IA family hydrolase [Candidatus Nanoarchaeia archaeon]
MVKITKKSKKVVLKNNKNTNKIKAIIFDVNGVLMLGRGKDVHEYMAQKLKSNIERWFDTIEPYWSEIVKDESKTLSFLTNVTQEYQIPESKIGKLLRKAFKKRFKKNRKLIKIIKKLNKKGYKTAIFSDQTSFSYDAFKKYNLDSIVDITLWSQKEGLRKPDMKFYKLLIKRLKLPAKNCLFVDNHDWNLIPAKKLGIKTILFEDNKQTINDLKSLGVKW